MAEACGLGHDVKKAFILLIRLQREQPSWVNPVKQASRVL
jgi:hypothetical protein